MRLLILGVTGGVGGHAVRLAVEQGYHITCLPRSPLATAYPGVRVVIGEVLDRGTLATCLDGQDAVISCLGIRRRWPHNPWSRLLSPASLCQTVARHLIALCARRGSPRRVVVLSACGVGDSLATTNRLMRFLIRRSNLRTSYDDLGKMERLLSVSDLDWLCPRPVTLTNRWPWGRAGEVDRYALTSFVTRRAVAAWLVEQLARTTAPAARTPSIGLGTSAPGSEQRAGSDLAAR
jgi:putative NADH-flavin reductase